MNNEIRMRADKNYNLLDTIGITILQRRDNGVSSVVSVEWRDLEEGQMYPYSWSIPLRCAQELMDDLWNCGIRPSEGTGSAGSLAATQAHLKDMRKLVETALDVNLGS